MGAAERAKGERKNAQNQRDDARRRESKALERYRKEEANKNAYEKRLNDYKIKAANDLLAVEANAKNIGNANINTNLSGMNREFNNYTEKKDKYLDSVNQTVLTTFDIFLNKTQAQINDLINGVTNENAQLKKQVEYNIVNGNKTKYVKSDYQQIEIEKITSQNKIFWHIFYGLVITLGIITFYYFHFKNRFLLIVFVILLFYPFFIYPLELLLYQIYLFLKKVLDTSFLSNVYAGDY